MKINKRASVEARLFVLCSAEGEPQHALFVHVLLSVLNRQPFVVAVNPLAGKVEAWVVGLLTVGYLLDTCLIVFLYCLSDVQLVDADITLDVCAIDGSDIIELVCELF